MISKKHENKKIGNLGEDIACKFLVKQGYSIVQRNYLKKYGEIDIVALKKNIYYFIEVKTVRNEQKLSDNNVIRETDQHRPEDNIHAYKRKRLSRTIESYILDKKIDGFDFKIVFISISLDFSTRLAKLSVLYDVL